MKRNNSIDIQFVYCDFSNPYHCRRLAELINEYIADPMGGGRKLTKQEQLYLIDGLANHPSGFVLFACHTDTIVGLATCFINFSTFKVRPYINIHDIIIEKKYRGKGIGEKLLLQLEKIALKKNYCKINLEVRNDNLVAQNLYKKMGFTECTPPMWFWTKDLTIKSMEQKVTKM
jgi:ribosomal protein S18 acetylase RimI-like enzyme